MFCRNYSFKYDFTPYFTEAAARDFTIVAYDAEGNVCPSKVTDLMAARTEISEPKAAYTAGFSR